MGQKRKCIGFINFCPAFALAFEDKFVLVYTTTSERLAGINFMDFENYLRNCYIRVGKIYALELGTSEQASQVCPILLCNLGKIT